MKVLIIEDEKPNADRLIRLLRQIEPNIEILEVLDSISDTVIWFNPNENPDVVMLDVRLSDGLSFDILNRIEINSPVIFTTAYDEYAVKAFKYNSVDYLLKPIEKEELDAAIKKLKAKTISHIQADTLNGLLNYLQPKDFRTRFLLPYRDGYKTVLVSDVFLFYSEMKMSRAKLENGQEEVIPQTLEELEQQLNPKQFFRANRQYLLRIDTIEKVHNYFNGKLKIDLKKHSELEIIVSREKATAFKNWLDF